MSVFDSYRNRSSSGGSFADRISQSQSKWSQEQKKKRKKNPQKNQDSKEGKRKIEAATKEAERLYGATKPKKQEGFNPFKFVADISRPTSQGGANVFADAGNFVKDQIVKPTVDSARVAKEQADVGIRAKTKGAGFATSRALNSKLLPQYKEDLKRGDITQKQYDEVAKQIKRYGAKTDKAIKGAEKETGVKYDQNAGAVATLETLTNLSGTGLLAKFVAKKAFNVGTKVAEKTIKKSTTKPTPAPKKGVLDSSQATDPLKVPTQQTRAVNYKPDVTKIRVTSQEAVTKLKRAGYTTDESKKILEDVLPEKGLSMPGSPKKIGYKEDKILEAANEFDKTPPLGEMKKNPVVDEMAASYNTVDDYINEAVERTWKDNKKGAGTNIVYKSSKESGIGSDSLRGTRVSENNPYYRVVFEETGKAPTKTRIQQDIRNFLDGEDNAARYILDPEERGVVDLIKEREIGLSTKTDAPTGIGAEDGSNLTPLAAKGEAAKGTSKLAASTKDEAVKEKLIKKTQAETVDTPQYNKANMEQQADYATNLIKTAPEDAIDIAMGRKAPPEHILQQMVYNAVEDHAKKIGGEKGANLLLQLSRSRQSTNLTKMGQEIRAAAERDPHSPVTLMQEVKLARAEAAKKRGKDISKAAKKDAADIKKLTPKVKKEDWDSFVKSLEC